VIFSFPGSVCKLPAIKHNPDTGCGFGGEGGYTSGQGMVPEPDRHWPNLLGLGVSRVGLRMGGYLDGRGANGRLRNEKRDAEGKDVGWRRIPAAEYFRSSGL